MVRADRMWVYKRLNSDGLLNREFINGVDEFVNFAKSKPDFLDGKKIRCPCSKCRNTRFQLPNDIKFHLYKHGFVTFPKYYEWIHQGEPYDLSSREVIQLPQPIATNSNVGETCSSSNPGPRITLESIQEQLDGLNSKMASLMERLERVEARQEHRIREDDVDEVGDLRERLTNVELQLGPALTKIQSTLNQLQNDVGRNQG